MENRRKYLDFIYYIFREMKLRDGRVKSVRMPSKCFISKAVAL